MKNIENIRVSPENYAIDPEAQKEIEKIYGDLNTAWFKEEKQNVRLTATGEARRYILRNPGPNLTIIDDAQDRLYLEMVYHRDVEGLCTFKFKPQNCAFGVYAKESAI